MTTIANHQFEILPALDAIDGQVFGIGADVSMNEDGFHPGSTSWATQDVQASQGHINFGRDALTGPVWAWDLHVNRDDEAGALETLGSIATAWRALHIRRTPGAMLPVRYMLNDRVRRIYGRPGNFEPTVNNQILSGYVDITCDFQAVDGFTYDDNESSVGLAIQSGAVDAAAGGGFYWPVTFPVQSLAPTEQVSALVVGGDAPTSPIVRFTGPVVNPLLEVDGWTLALNFSVPAGHYVEIDTRPWNISVLYDGTIPIPGAIGRRVNLFDLKLSPGPLSARFEGDSLTGTATCTIRWRGAYNSI